MFFKIKITYRSGNTVTHYLDSWEDALSEAEYESRPNPLKQRVKKVEALAVDQGKVVLSKTFKGR